MRTSFIASSLASLVALSSFAGCGASADEPSESESDLTTTLTPKRFVPGGLTSKKNFTLWSKYCLGDAHATVRPVPNYENELVMSAARQLSRVADHSFAIYGGISKHHKTDVPAEVASDVKPKAHEFLGYLCGEFRDRAKLMENKLQWVANMNYLDDASTDDFDPSRPPFQQMRQSEYAPYIQMARDVFGAKQYKLQEDGNASFTIGSRTIDTPVPPSSVCETKYIFAEYLRKGRAFDDMATFSAGYEAYKAQCLPGDEDYYYDFRGDSNIKPNSPESNGMIWFAQTMTTQCLADAQAPYSRVNNGSNLTPDDCRRYFQFPFTSRFNAARAGLASWVLVDPNGEGLSSDAQYTVSPHAVTDPSYVFGDLAPYKALDQNGTPVPLLEGFGATFSKRKVDTDMGIAALMNQDKEKVEKIIQIAVDRHTDWYSSKYDDEMTFRRKKNDQAYSPFVASSYEMAASDAFTSPGYTATSPDPTASQYKHWMFVFKVHKNNWYTPARLASRPPGATNTGPAALRRTRDAEGRTSISRSSPMAKPTAYVGGPPSSSTRPS